MVQRIDNLRNNQGPSAVFILMRAFRLWTTKLSGLKKNLLEEVSIMQRRIIFFKEGAALSQRCHFGG